MSTLTLARTVPVTPRAAYDAWVDPDVLATWWWPHLADTTYAVDARPGGVLAIDSPTAGIGVRGEFLEVEPGALLRFTWRWMSGDEPAADSAGRLAVDTVEVRFVPVEDGTEVTVRHTSEEHVPEGGAARGWADVLARYAALHPSGV